MKERARTGPVWHTGIWNTKVEMTIIIPRLDIL
jgi:hypothetical protein